MNTPGPYDQVNFLPDWYVQHERRRIQSHRLITVLAMLMLVAATLVGLTYKQRNQLQNYHAALQQQIAAAEGQLTEVSKLQNARTELVRQVKTYRRLARPLNVSQVNEAITALAPESVYLTQLRLGTANRQKRVAVPGQVDANGKPVYVDESYGLYQIVIQGVAPSDVQIANFVGQLAGSGLFRDVQMAHSRAGKIDNAITREFRIHMNVPLDRKYEFVAVAEEVGDVR